MVTRSCFVGTLRCFVGTIWVEALLAMTGISILVHVITPTHPTANALFDKLASPSAMLMNHDNPKLLLLLVVLLLFVVKFGIVIGVEVMQNITLATTTTSRQR